MPNNIRNWISRLSETYRAFSESERAALDSAPIPMESSERVRLALRIVALKSRLDDLENRPAFISETVVKEMAAAQDIAARANEPIQKILPERQKKTKKASFSAASLDDVAGLLNAFGGLAGPPSEQSAADENPRKEVT